MQKVALFQTNLEKLRLYFGHDLIPDAHCALALTLRNVTFHYEAYESVKKQIYAHTKWYQTIRTSFPLLFTYYVQVPDQVAHTLAQFSQLAKHKIRGRTGYLAALHIEDAEQMKKAFALRERLVTSRVMHAHTLPFQQVALLSKSSLAIEDIAKLFEQYVDALTGIMNKTAAIRAATLFTNATHSFDAALITRMQALKDVVTQAGSQLIAAHFDALALLSLTNFQKEQFPALSAVHDTVCTVLKMKNNNPKSLLIATQLYTASALPDDTPVATVDWLELIDTFANDFSLDGADGGSDGGGGGE